MQLTVRCAHPCVPATMVPRGGGGPSSISVVSVSISVAWEVRYRSWTDRKGHCLWSGVRLVKTEKGEMDRGLVGTREGVGDWVLSW